MLLHYKVAILVFFLLKSAGACAPPTTPAPPPATPATPATRAAASPPGVLSSATAAATLAAANHPRELEPGEPLREVVVGVEPSVEWPAGHEPAAGAGASPADRLYFDCEASTAHGPMGQWKLLLMRRNADEGYATALVARAWGGE